MSQEITPNVYTALASAQAEFSAPIKGNTNPAFKSRYADLRAVVDAVAPALSRHGIAFHHSTVALGDDLAMRTSLTHGASGTSVHCDIPLLYAKRDMQGFKSATTYAKRIGLESVTGVAPDDDDGNGAVQSAPRAQRQPASVQPTQIAEPQEVQDAHEVELLGLTASGFAQAVREYMTAALSGQCFSADEVATAVTRAESLPAASRHGFWAKLETIRDQRADALEYVAHTAKTEVRA
jgi:hypothetical protein